MRITYGILFLIISSALFTSALGRDVWMLFFVWPALNFLALAFQYLFGWRCALRKRSDGLLSSWTLVFMLPYLALSYSVWHLQRLLSKEPSCNEVVPGLFIARRLLPGELPANISLIIDLTIEFAEPQAIRNACEYSSFPILDATAPDNVEMLKIVQFIVGHSERIVVHCANGHGRSATVVACVLISKGLSRDATDAIAQVRTARPRARLNSDQRRSVEKFIGT